MKTHFIPTNPLAPSAFPLDTPAPVVTPPSVIEEALPAPTELPVAVLEAGSPDTDSLPAGVTGIEGAEGVDGVEGTPGEPALDGRVLEDGVVVEQRAALSEELSARVSPEGGGVTAGPVYGDALDWMDRNGLAYDKTVYLRGYPQINSVWPCTLGVAMSHAAYLAGEGRAFEIHLPEVQDSLLVGGDETGRLYGVAQVASELTRLYEVQRGLFLVYQAKFPLRMTLGEQAQTGNVAEVFIMQLSQMLELAHERTRRAEGSLTVMDLISTSVAVSLKRIFGGLVPLNRLGELLQDSDRMEWLEANANDVLGLTPPRV